MARRKSIILGEQEPQPVVAPAAPPKPRRKPTPTARVIIKRKRRVGQ